MDKMFLLSDKEIKSIDEHYRKYFTEIGAKDTGIVMHEMMSDGLHIDLVHYEPTIKFPYHILATVGMSAHKMPNAPFSRLELIMFLPKNWKMDDKSLDDEKWFWPIAMLKNAARLPYYNDAFLSVGHTFSMDEDNKPFHESTKMCAGFVTFPSWLDVGVMELKCGGLLGKKKINFLCITAINEEELKKIRENGAEDFIENTFKREDGSDNLVVRA